jgi:hypothetical protein
MDFLRDFYKVTDYAQVYWVCATRLQPFSDERAVARVATAQYSFVPVQFAVNEAI